MITTRANSRSAAAALALALYCLATSACGGAGYVISPTEASQMDDPNWVIKREPKPQQPAAPADSLTQQAPEPAPVTPTVPPAPSVGAAKP